MSASVAAATLAAQRAYVAVAASAAGVDGAEVPRSGREAFVALYRCYNHGRQPTVAAPSRWRVRRAADGEASAIVECINAAFAIGPGDFDYARSASEGRTDQAEISACLCCCTVRRTAVRISQARRDLGVPG